MVNHKNVDAIKTIEQEIFINEKDHEKMNPADF